MVLDDLTAVLLDPNALAGDLKRAADAMHDLFCRIVPVQDQTGDTLLPAGTALSPHLAAMCIKDCGRTATFLRGVEQALRERQPSEVLDAGTGPFAPLVLPLMSKFPHVRFTLLDIHAFSIDALRTVTGHFGITNAELVLGDATTYRHPRPIDLLIVEVLQAALAREPQVAIVQHLRLQLAPDGVLIPERIIVEAMLVDGGAETRRAMGEPLAPGARLSLGIVAELTRDTEILERTVRVPEHPQKTPALFTRVQVYGEHVLDEYQSGITYPQFLWNSTLRAGEEVVFRYAQGARPAIVVSDPT